MARKTSFILNTINMALITPEEQEKMYSLLAEHNVTLVKITPAQRLVIYGLSEKSFQILQKDLDSIPLTARTRTAVRGVYVADVRCCPDPEQCAHTIAPTQRLGRKIHNISLPNPLPHKVKIAISGCSRCCTEPYVRDLGIIATRKGWKIVFGGNAGGRPRIADLIAENLSEEQVVSIVEKVLNFYITHASKRQRTARFVEKIGIDTIKEKILK